MKYWKRNFLLFLAVCIWMTIAIQVYVVHFSVKRQVTDGNDNIMFFLIGDWGGADTIPYTTSIQIATARHMELIADSLNAEFILALGDNFYETGVKDVNDKRFNESFEKVYTGESLNIPWYVIAGNHDWLGNVSAQIAYSNISTRWNFPFYYYPLTFTIPLTTDTIDIFMIDTTLLCDTEGLTTPQLQVLSERHWDWLETSLENSRAKFALTVGHMPVLSLGWHGSDSCLIDRLLPLLIKYNINGHIGGHDHSFQHYQIEENNATVDLIVCGPGSDVDDSQNNKEDIPEDALKFHWGDAGSLGGFCVAKVNANVLTFSFVASVLADDEESDDLLYQTDIYPRQLPRDTERTSDNT